MTGKKKGDTPSPIFEFTYKDKRKNIPTEELRDFVAEEEKQPEDHALSARPVARPATGLEGQGRAGPRRPGRAGRAHLHPGEDSPAGDHRGPARRRRSRARPSPAQPLRRLQRPPTFDDRVDFYHHEQNWSTA